MDRHLHPCPDGQWYGYTVGTRTLLCDGSQPCSCQPIKDTISFMPPCNSSGSCEPGGFCIAPFSGDKTPRCSFDDPRLVASNSVIPIPSSACGSALSTAINLEDPSYEACFLFLETVLTPALIPLLSEGVLGVAAGQVLAYGVWKSGFGSACMAEVNMLQKSFAGKSFDDLEPAVKCRAYNDALGWCEAGGFLPSERWDCGGGFPPDPSPGPPPLQKCDKKGGICVATPTALGRCGEDSLCHRLRRLQDLRERLRHRRRDWHLSRRARAPRLLWRFRSPGRPHVLCASRLREAPSGLPRASLLLGGGIQGAAGVCAPGGWEGPRLGL
jgi:hypothetical protein